MYTCLSNKGRHIHVNLLLFLLVSKRNLASSRLDGPCCCHSNSGSNPDLAIFSVVFY